jgi:hypothetical protein
VIAVAFIGKAFPLTLLFALNFLLFFFSTTSNFLLSSSCSLVIAFFVYAVIKGCIEVVAELNNRFTDYEALHLFATKSFKSLDSRRNLLSLLRETYEVPCTHSEAQFKMKKMVRDMLRKKILKAKGKNPSGTTKLSSPLTRLVFLLLEKLNFVDEVSLRNFAASLHDLSFSLYLNAKKLRELIAVERLKYKVLQIASSMTLGFVIKTFFVFARLSSMNLAPNIFVFTSFALLSITIFTAFAYIIQLRYPSFKNLTICLLIFVVLLFLPPYEWV